jgi:hypothetical protein
MKTPQNRKPKLTDPERYRRFLDAANEVGASEDSKDFERVFDQVIKGSLTPRSNLDLHRKHAKP